MKENEKLLEGHKMNIPDGNAIVMPQYSIIGDDIICTDIFIEPIDCDFIIKIHVNAFVGTVQESMKDYHEYVKNIFLSSGINEDELVDFLINKKED